MSTLSDKDRPDKDLPDEQQLDDYLRGGSAVSQQYRQLRSDDVPAELDRLVLHQAQEAVKARPAKSRTWMRWAGPVALAASTVLVVSIVIESGVHEEPYLSVPASAPADLPPRQEAAEQPVSANAVRDKSAAGDASAPSVVHVVPMESESLVDAPAAFMPEAPALSEDRALALQRPEPPPPPAAPKVASPPPTVQLDAAPPEVARREEADASARARVRAPAIAPPPVAISSRAQAREASAELEEAVVTGIKRPEQKQTAGPRNTVAAPAAAGSASHADEQAEKPRNYSDPEQWLRDIRELRKQRKHEEADREWRRFRYVFPNYEVADTDPARGTLR